MIYVEWLKLKDYRPFWVIAASYPVTLLASMLMMMKLEHTVVAQITEKGGMKAALAIGRSPFVFPEVWQTTAYVASWLHVIPAVIVLLAITNEFQFRTHRQNLLDGWSRARFFLAKVALVVLVSAFATGIVTLVAAGAGFARGSFEWGRMHWLGLFFLQSLSYGFFSMLLAYTFRRGLLAVLFFFIYSAVLEKFVGWMAGKYVLVLKFLMPLESVDHLVPFPILKVQQAAEKFTPGLPSEGVLMAAALFWMAFYLMLSWRGFNSQDL